MIQIPKGFFVSFLLFLYITSLSILALYGLHRIILVWKADSNPPAPKQPIVINNEHSPLPSVLIQLPIFNEANVVVRLIDTICVMKWTKETLHVQVLDDSTDETQYLAQEAVIRWAKKGVSISYHHRSNRVGYKAGALKEGLLHHDAPYIAIFDADFMPPSDFLLQMMPYLYPEEIGMVQARWGHINQEENLLTSLSSVLLDAHFVIEHNARNQSGCYFNFNGTAGIWKRECIQEAGGWSHDTITEDLDLSYRAQLCGWNFVFLQDIVADAELPANIHAFRLQQYRWAKGSIQTARKLLPRILSASIPMHIKIEALFHLTANIGYPICLIWIILLPILSVQRPHFHLLWEMSIISCGFIGVLFFYGCTLYKTRQPMSITRLFLVLGLGVGMSIQQSTAFLAGCLSSDSVFERTPKKGTIQKKHYSISKNAIRWLEMAMMLYCFWGISHLYQAQLYAGIPFLLCFGWGFGYVSGFVPEFRRLKRMQHKEEIYE